MICDCDQTNEEDAMKRTRNVILHFGITLWLMAVVSRDVLKPIKIILNL